MTSSTAFFSHFGFLLSRCFLPSSSVIVLLFFPPPEGTGVCSRARVHLPYAFRFFFSALKLMTLANLSVVRRKLSGMWCRYLRVVMLVL